MFFFLFIRAIIHVVNYSKEFGVISGKHLLAEAFWISCLLLPFLQTIGLMLYEEVINL